MGYAVSFNKKYRRHEKLSQSRYKTILYQEDIYLKELVRCTFEMLVEKVAQWLKVETERSLKIHGYNLGTNGATG